MIDNVRLCVYKAGAMLTQGEGKSCIFLGVFPTKNALRTDCTHALVGIATVFGG